MKQIKILGVLAIALTLGLTACGGGSGDKSGEQQSGGSSAPAHVHQAADDAQWQNNDTQHWKDCKDNDGGKVNLGSHTWVADDSKQNVAATCQAEGKAFEKCSVCGKTRERTLSKTAHTYEQVDGADKVVWTTEPDCTHGGEGEKECTVCHEKTPVTSDPLGHVYAQDEAGEDIVVWTTEPTCEKGGVGEKECTRCHEKAAVTADALGHDIHLRADTVEPAAGKAAVRIYECSRCDVTYFGFKATEVSENSGRLVFDPAEPAEGVEQGARFWGRPIGNAMELGEDGSASGSDAEKIYDPTVEGDLFEYVFDLTAAQVAELGETCLLYCDAKPANYLNGQDFWACDPNAEEWTPGYYIEGEHAGEPIADYRYILYVDDQPVAFDPEMKAPVARSYSSTNIPRGEYVMPYKFHLHVGENKISLRMAGGYRSLFYNFTFRPLVETEPEDPGEPAVEPAAPTWPAENPVVIDTSAWTAGTPAQNKAGKTYTPLTSAAGKNGVKIAFADVSSGAYDGSKLSSSADSGVTYQVKAAKAGIYQMIMKAKVSSSGNGKPFAGESSRGVVIKVNGFESQANVYAARTEVEAGLNTSERVQFVLGLVNLTGGEDSIYIENRYYRIDFDTASDVIFAEI